MSLNEAQNIDTKNSENVLIGMGGWEIQPFQGVFYPSRLDKSFRKLEYYSRFFDLVEVNATFYNSSLSPERAKQWLKDVSANQRFVFTLKLFRGFTHTFDATQNDALAIHRLLEPLREANKFGGLLAQFPSTFNKSSSRLNYIAKLHSMFPEDPLFLDLRHKSWGDDALHQFYIDNGLILVNVDLPPLPNHIQFNSLQWNGIAYYRMMGRNSEAWKDPRNTNRYLYNYSEEELKDLVEKIKNVNASKKYVVFHNDRQAFSIVNGKQLEHALNPSKQLFAPSNLLAAFPQLKEYCFVPAEDSNLFTTKQKTLSSDKEERNHKPQKKKFKRKIVNNIPQKNNKVIKRRRGFNH